MNWLKRLLTEDVGLKLLALACALLLWLGMDEMIAEELTKTIRVSREESFRIPKGWMVISVTDAGGAPVKEVKLRLRGTRRDFESVEEPRLAIVLNEGLSRGTVPVDLTCADVVLNERGERPVRMRAQFEPRRLFVRLEREVSKTATVRPPEIVGEQKLREAGYVLLGRPEVVPGTVKVSGPASELESADEPLVIETEPVDISERREPFHGSVPLARQVTIAGRRVAVRASPRAVVVSVAIVAAGREPIERDIEYIPVEARNVPEGFAAGLQPERARRIRVRGPQAVVSRLSPDRISLWVDLAELPGGAREGVLTARVELPGGVTLVSALPEVRVTLTPAPPAPTPAPN